MNAAVVAADLRRRLVLPVALLLASATLFALFVADPGLDEAWENHPAHFWLVLGAAAASVGVGYAVSLAARRRRDARLFLVSLAFIAAAGFLGLHALATPGVVLGKNAGFELATPFGLAVAGAFAAASSLELGEAASARVMALAMPLLGGLLVLLGAWGVVSLTSAQPLAKPLKGGELDGWQISLAAVGLVVYGIAAGGYFRLYRRRGDRVLVVVAFAFALLAEAMLVIAWSRNWHTSWWQWHALMLGAFTAIAVAARSEWHEERWSPLYLERTFAGSRDVSVLFADLEGFTAFSERAGVAEVAEMLNAYFGALVPLMERVGGEVHQIIGDELMIVFNKDGDLPDHAAAAVRAALLLQREASKIAAGHPDWPRFRAGINTGPVHAGVLGGKRGHRKHAVIGATVNLAARLQSHAPVGEVVIGAATARRLPNAHALEQLPPLRVKGMPEPVEAYLVRGAGGA